MCIYCRVIRVTKNWFEELYDQSHSTDEECNDNITKVLPHGTSPAAREQHCPVPCPHPSVDQDALQHEKWRALQLLEACAATVEGEEQSTTAGGGVEEGAEGGGGVVESGAGLQRIRRRRVRRRRRSALRSISPRDCSPPPLLPPLPSVLRNLPSPAVRQPRLVRALDPPILLTQVPHLLLFDLHNNIGHSYHYENKEINYDMYTTIHCVTSGLKT